MREPAGSANRFESLVLEGCGHSPQFENPQAWIEAMQKFLASVS